jgi:hypothetical protein
MKRVGLFIGIDKYKNGIQELECASEDALALGTLFARKGFDRVEHLLNEKAVSDAIISRVLDMTADLKAGDLFLLYFAGHGVEFDGKHYLIGANGFKSAKIRQGRLETGELLDVSGEIAGLNRMFILDCCRKDLVAGRSTAYACPEKWNSRDISLGFGGGDAGPKNVPPFIITSCSGGEQAYELKDREHGVFTSALLTVLNDARNSVRGFGQLIVRVDEAMRQLAPGRDCPQHMTASFNPGVWDRIPLFAEWQTTPAAASTKPPEDIPSKAPRMDVGEAAPGKPADGESAGIVVDGTKDLASQHQAAGGTKKRNGNKTGVQRKTSGGRITVAAARKMVGSLHDGDRYFVGSFDEQNLKAALASYGNRLVRSPEDVIIHYDDGTDKFILTTYGIVGKRFWFDPKWVFFNRSSVVGTTSADFFTTLGNGRMLTVNGVKICAMDMKKIQQVIDLIQKLIADCPE